MISKITFITGNKGKFEEAKNIFSGSGIEIFQEAYDTPEIQIESAEEIAKFSASYVGNKLNKPLFVMDRGFYIKGLNGFPGPFIKFINKWLTPEQVLSLLGSNTNRDAYWVTAIGVYIPGKEVIVFASKDIGSVPLRIFGELGYMADKLFQPEKSEISLSQMTKENYDKFWENSACWKEMIGYLTNA